MPLDYKIMTYIILGLWLTWVAIWTISAFYTKRSVYREPLSKRLIYLAGGLVAWAIIRLTPLAHSPYRLPVAGLWNELLGIALCLAGLSFAVWARFYLGTNWSGFITLKQDHQLIQTGPYRFVRHPIYTGVLTAIVGTMLALFPSLAGVVIVLVLIAAFTYKFRQEEQLMTRQFPDAYPAYKKRVRGALIPFVF